MDDNYNSRLEELQIEYACLGEKMDQAEDKMKDKKIQYLSLKACLKQSEKNINFFQCLKRTSFLTGGAFILGGVGGLCFGDKGYALAFLVAGALIGGGAFLFKGLKKHSQENQIHLSKELSSAKTVYFNSIEEYHEAKEKFEIAHDKYFAEKKFVEKKNEQEEQV